MEDYTAFEMTRLEKIRKFELSFAVFKAENQSKKPNKIFLAHMMFLISHLWISLFSKNRPNF